MSRYQRATAKPMLCIVTMTLKGDYDEIQRATARNQCYVS